MHIREMDQPFARSASWAIWSFKLFNRSTTRDDPAKLQNAKALLAKETLSHFVQRSEFQFDVAENQKPEKLQFDLFPAGLNDVK